MMKAGVITSALGTNMDCLPASYNLTATSAAVQRTKPDLTFLLLWIDNYITSDRHAAGQGCARCCDSGCAGYGRCEGLRPDTLSRNMPVLLVLPTCSKSGLSLPILWSYFR